MKNAYIVRYITRLVTFTLLALLITGCQSVNREQTAQANKQTRQQHRENIASLREWQVKGKLIFKSPQEKFSVSLNWSQNQAKSDIRLTTFLGMSMLKMISDGNKATVIRDGKTSTSDDPESLLLTTTGITLPVNDLPHWMKGAVVDGNKQTEVYDQYNRIERISLLDENGQPWSIHYQSYQTVDGFQLPKKIRLTGNTINITIKISDWELNSD